MNRRDFIRAAAGFAAAIGIGATVKLPEMEFTEPEKKAVNDFGIHVGQFVATDGLSLYYRRVWEKYQQGDLL